MKPYTDEIVRLMASISDEAAVVASKVIGNANFVLIENLKNDS